MSRRTVDPSALCWNLLEVFKKEMPRSGLSAESRSFVAKARKWMRTLPSASNMRVLAAHALVTLDLPTDEESQLKVDYIRDALAWLPDDPMMDCPEPTDEELQELFSEMVADMQWPRPPGVPKPGVLFAREVLKRWGR